MVIDGYILDIQPKQVGPTLALYFRKRHRPFLPSGELGFRRYRERKFRYCTRHTVSHHNVNTILAYLMVAVYCAPMSCSTNNPGEPKKHARHLPSR